MPVSMDRDDHLMREGRAQALALEAAVAQAVVGQARAIRRITTAVFARGHVLLQGDVGVGKTTLLRAFARAMGGRFGRIEGTVDLMPNDLLYHTYISAEGKPAVEPGPLIRDGEALAIFFFNEINRARPQVHALLLRAMAERSVQAFNREWRFPRLQVFADRNRVEREETFEIASAARDRFMMEIAIDAPADEAARLALAFDPRFHDTDALIGALPQGVVDMDGLIGLAAAIQRGVAASPALQRYVLRLWEGTARPQDAGVRLEALDVDSADLVLAGASPRGVGMLLQAARVSAWIEGRSHVLPEDIQAVFPEVMAHRLCFQPVHELRRAELAPALMKGLLDQVPAP